MTEKIKSNKILMDILVSGMGCIMMAFAIASILKPNGLVTGGFTGLSIILGYLFNINYTYIYYGFSLVVMLSAFVFMGKKNAFKILVISLIFPIILILVDKSGFHLIENDMFLSSVFFGVVGGIGGGLVYKRGFSTGGTDTIAQIFHKKIFPFISLSQIIFFMDIFVILFAALVFDRNIALYGFISNYVFAKSVDAVLFGFGSKKLKMEIISKFNDQIADYIMKDIGRGLTILDVTGGYSNEIKSKILTICSPRETMLIKRFVADIDARAFIYVLPVVSVWGEGTGFDKLEEES
ncbi:MAG: YitT family protein [Peptostreptococcaceae bacterium]|nr:YitT family protein [Peptostreptococcaceae bacterium]